MEAGCYTEPDTELTRYDTATFRARREGPPVTLFRFDVLIPAEAVTERALRNRLALALDWFEINVDEETGLGAYLYRPSGDRYRRKLNAVRMLATAWAMAELDHFLGTSALAGPVQAAIAHYGAAIRRRGETVYLDVGGRANLGLTAFMTLLLYSAPGDGYSHALARRLADGILDQQAEDGSFATSYVSDKRDGVDYYPGQALLALMFTYMATRDDLYRDAVARAFPYYREYWRSNRNAPFLPWQTQAYAMLYRVTAERELARFIFEMSDWLIERHQRRRGGRPDELGGFPLVRPGFATATFLEGLEDAYTLAIRRGDGWRARRYGDAIRLGLRFLLQLQITERNAFYLRNPSRAIGGFRRSLVSNAQRNDYTQHGVRALMKALAAGVLAPGAP